MIFWHFKEWLRLQFWRVLLALAALHWQAIDAYLAHFDYVRAPYPKNLDELPVLFDMELPIYEGPDDFWYLPEKP